MLDAKNQLQQTNVYLLNTTVISQSQYMVQMYNCTGTSNSILTTVYGSVLSHTPNQTQFVEKYIDTNARRMSGHMEGFSYHDNNSLR